jgi:hypothetical protein
MLSNLHAKQAAEYRPVIRPDNEIGLVEIAEPDNIDPDVAHRYLKSGTKRA